jgi:hypothetical protein
MKSVEMSRSRLQYDSPSRSTWAAHDLGTGLIQPEPRLLVGPDVLESADPLMLKRHGEVGAPFPDTAHRVGRKTGPSPSIGVRMIVPQARIIQRLNLFSAGR